jgi:hypothetical protein
MSMTWGEGIHGPGEFSFPSAYDYDFLNVWWHDAGKVYLTVLAGSDDGGNPIVLVLHNDPVSLRTTLMEPLTPDVSGPVRIVDDAGKNLVLESVETGQRIGLNVSRLTFFPA